MTARPRLARFFLLLTVFLCAACGLVYELALVALGGYLIGNTVFQTSLVLSIMVFAMGVGSLAAKPLQRRAVGAFAVVEGLLALIGGLSVLLLYVMFAWVGIYTPAMTVVAFVVGLLIGAEIPLLMTLLQRIRRQEPGGAVADMFAVDYLGALVGGLCFPLLLLPTFGQLKGVLVVGAVNAVAGVAAVLWIFRRQTRRFVQGALLAGMAVVLTVLTGAYVYAGDIEMTARQRLYRDPIVHAERTPYQEIVITESIGFMETADMRLFLNGDLQFSSLDEYRYHEALVHPAFAAAPERSSVLILGGGDGLALREVLRYEDVAEVTLVELDKAMTDLGAGYGPLRDLNRDALSDPRVEVVNADAFSWLRNAPGPYDTVLVDFPDPEDIATAKLYSVEFYTMLSRVLAPEGRLVVQAGSPFFAPRTYWSVDATLRAAGFATTPYQVDVPSFGNWGFVLADRGRTPPRLRLAPDAPRLRFLDDAVLRAATVFPVDRRERDVRASTLMDPVVLEYAQREWQFD
ncbi:polyamine aminopropyltransferase [Streptomyces johnsoniae]|uniref:Polyamine aminopropyltransferase n=1 Tax=Streptomyces johnsoniae TaxID=3075532 RepID=A0ABU2S8E7_9ACTN|nr:polyamine aminopropyltransferase [Streptomyces sp. DSM 41886]MDT0443940.1 polyamine aminopropyltransferase [Streptomyces sp. DSM 41886]